MLMLVQRTHSARILSLISVTVAAFLSVKLLLSAQYYPRSFKLIFPVIMQVEDSDDDRDCCSSEGSGVVFVSLLHHLMTGESGQQ